MLMTNENYNPLLNTRISFDGTRVPAKNPNSLISKNQYFERVFIRDNDGDELEAQSIYDDEGSGFTTVISQVKYVGLGGTGKYSNVSHVIIKFDNEGNIFGKGKKKTREVFIYGN